MRRLIHSLAATTIALMVTVLLASVAQAASDPLPSWNEGATKSAIVSFVTRVTTDGTEDFVPVPERIAVFDNDGTLWSEQPLYFQGFFALSRIRAMAPEHTDWATTEPFKSAIAGDTKGLMATGEKGIMQVLLAAHSNITATDFATAVAQWGATAKHPGTGMRFTQMIFQPMLELLDYLRANGFKTFIVSGGGVDFMRVFTEDLYGIPPEQVVGTTGDARFELDDGVPVIIKEPKILLVDDKAGKPVGIYRHIGRRPIFAAGNSDGDLEMLEYTTIPESGSDTTLRFGLIVHHTDGEREFAYDRESHMGKLDTALDAAPARGWTVVDMKADWRIVYPATSR